MRVLIVEDDEDNIALFESQLARDNTIELTIARSRDAAVDAAKAGTYDLIVLDLRIPTNDGVLDAETNHGLAVHSLVREIARGTPIVVFSAFGTIRLVTELAEKSDREDVWGSGVTQTLTQFKEKSDFKECLAYIKETANEVNELSQIEISLGGGVIDLTNDERKVLRIFGRLHQGVNVRVATLGGGLSSAKTLRLTVHAANGNVSSNAVVKLGPIAQLELERDRYQKFVAPVIAVGGFAHVIRFVRAGAAGVGGIFYGDAKEYDLTLANALSKQPNCGRSIVHKLRKLETEWQACTPKSVRISEIRQSLVSDKKHGQNAARLKFPWREMEDREVRVKLCPQHCDLHGLNVLIKGADEPLLIDYAEVGEAPASLDPLILELSLVFHPAFENIRKDWPTHDQTQHWDNLEVFAAHCPYEEFLRECRDWAFGCEAGDKGVFATAYSYAVRQLSYPDTNPDFAAEIAGAAYNRFMAS
jgi:CheY-like chemotaxis protein